MTREDQVFTLLVESNPVARVDDIDFELVGGAHYLDDIERRSSEVTQLDTKTETPEQNKTRNRGLILGLAAAVAVVLVLAVVLSQEDAPPVADDPVVTTLSQEDALAERYTLLLANYADASNGGDIAEVMSLFTNSYPPEMRRHPFVSDVQLWDTNAVRTGVELFVAAQGSGSGLEFFDLEFGDPDSVVKPDITFNWRLLYGADGSEAGGEAGCIGGKTAKVFIRGSQISSFDWGFADPSLCGT